MAKKQPLKFTNCKRCDGLIPSTRRSNSLYCSTECQRNQGRTLYNNKHKDYFKKYHSGYNLKNRKKITEYQRKYRGQDPSKDVYSQARSLGFRSMFEVNTAKDLLAKGIAFEYEKVKLPYTIKGIYTPDFVLANGIILECKGYLSPSDKKKMKYVRLCYPEKDIRILFMSKNEKNFKWAERNNYLYAVGCIPYEWIKEEHQS